MGLVSFLVSANATPGSSGAASPAAVSVTASRRDMPFSDAGNRLEWAAFRAIRSKFIVGLLIDDLNGMLHCFTNAHMDRARLFGWLPHGPQTTLRSSVTGRRGF